MKLHDFQSTVWDKENHLQARFGQWPPFAIPKLEKRNLNPGPLTPCVSLGEMVFLSPFPFISEMQARTRTLQGVVTSK